MTHSLRWLAGKMLAVVLFVLLSMLLTLMISGTFILLLARGQGIQTAELLNHRSLTPADFVENVGAYQLKPEKRAVFFTKFEERLNEDIQHPLFGSRVTYRRCLELQARLLGKTLTGEIGESPTLLVK